MINIKEFYHKNSNKLIVAVTGCLLFTAMGVTYFTHKISMGILFSSDSLHLSALCRDLASDFSNLSYWLFQPAPSFFPDMPAFFLIKTLLKNNYYVHFFFAVFQVMLAYLLALKIASEVSKNRNNTAIISILFILSAAFLLASSTAPYIFVFFPGYHFGNLLNSLIFILSIVMTIKSDFKKPIWVISLAFVIAAGVLSDLIFVVTVLIPAMFSCYVLYFLRKINKVYLLKFTFIAVCSMAVGLIIKKSLDISASGHYTSPNLPEVKQEIFLLAKLLVELYRKAPVSSSLLVLFYILVCYRTINIIFSKKEVSSELFILITVIVGPILNCSSLVVNGLLSPNNYLWDSRYIINIFWMPIVFGWLVLQPFETKFRKTFIIRFALVVSFFAGIYASIPRDKMKYVYYPEFVASIDKGISAYEKAHGEDLSNGIASFWHARYVTELSKENLNLFQMKYPLEPFKWINNTENYRSSYDFIIIPLRQSGSHMLDRTLVEKINGPPVHEFKWRGEAVVMIYGKDKLHIAPPSSEN